jgi:2-hydroxychromene-2-carboxylate isomerase
MKGVARQHHRRPVSSRSIYLKGMKVMPPIACYFSPQSGYAYLGHDRLCRIAAEHGASILWRPVDIAKVFAESGTTSPAKQSPVRLAYRQADMARGAKALGLPLNAKPPFWPVNTIPACRMIIAAERSGADAAAVIGAVFRAVWTRDMDIAATQTLTRIATELGLDAAALARLAETPEVAGILEGYTAEAVAAGVFGSPSYVVGGEVFWGQDAAGEGL